MPSLTERVLSVLTPVFDDIAPGADPVLRSSDHADYQVNGVMGLAKGLDRNPRDVAIEIVARLDFGDLVESIEIAGPGFLNLTLSTTALTSQLDDMGSTSSLGIARDWRFTLSTP